MEAEILKGDSCVLFTTLLVFILS